MALKYILVIFGVLAVIEIEAVKWPNLRRAKRSMTTICVEIKPSTPMEEPYFMCKGADLSKSDDSAVDSSQPNYGYPQTGQNQQSQLTQPPQASQPLPPQQPQQQQQSKFDDASTFQPQHNVNFQNTDTASNYGPKFPYFSNNKQNFFQATQDSNEFTPEQTAALYGFNAFSGQPAQPPSGFQPAAPFQAFNSYFPRTKNDDDVTPIQTPAFRSNYKNEAPKKTSQPDATYANTKSTTDTKIQAYDRAPTSYAANRNGNSNNPQTNNDSNYNSPYNIESNKQQQQPQQQEQSEQQQPHNNAKSPYDFNTFDVNGQITIPSVASAPKSYGLQTTPYGNAADTPTTAYAIATGFRPTSATASYVAATAQKPRTAASYFKSNDAQIGAAPPQLQQHLPTGRHDVIHSDVMDVPNLDFRIDELRRFRNNLKYLPDVRNAFKQSLPTPFEATMAQQQQLQKYQNFLRVMEYYDDPIMRTFYSSLLESPSMQSQDVLLNQVYPVNAEQSNYYQRPAALLPSSSQSPPSPQLPQLPLSPPTPPSESQAIYSPAVRPKEPEQISCPETTPQLIALQKLSQPCISSPENDAFYAPPALVPLSCVRDFGFQPIIIACPCLGTQSNSYKSLPPVQLNSAAQQQPDPIVGAPFGFGLFSPLGLTPLSPFHPFGLLGAPAPNLQQKAGESTLAVANPLIINADLNSGTSAPAIRVNTKLAQANSDVTTESTETTDVDFVQATSNVGNSNAAIATARPTKYDNAKMLSSTPTVVAVSTQAIAKGSESQQNIFEDTTTSSEETEELTVNGYLSLAEAKLNGEATPAPATASPKSRDTRKHQNSKALSSQNKRKYLQNL